MTTKPEPSAGQAGELDWLMLLASAHGADWQQVVLNGGPPCFAICDGKFCLRAKRWFGHDGDHAFISLERLLGSLQEREQDLSMNLRAMLAARPSGGEENAGAQDLPDAHTNASDGDGTAGHTAGTQPAASAPLRNAGPSGEGRESGTGKSDGSRAGKDESRHETAPSPDGLASAAALAEPDVVKMIRKLASLAPVPGKPPSNAERMLPYIDALSAALADEREQSAYYHKQGVEYLRRAETAEQNDRRYRWLREHFMHVYCADDDIDEGNFHCDSGESLDAALDTALTALARDDEYESRNDALNHLSGPGIRKT